MQCQLAPSTLRRTLKVLRSQSPRGHLGWSALWAWQSGPLCVVSPQWTTPTTYSRPRPGFILVVRFDYLWIQSTRTWSRPLRNFSIPMAAMQPSAAATTTCLCGFLTACFALPVRKRDKHKRPEMARGCSEESLLVGEIVRMLACVSCGGTLNSDSEPVCCWCGMCVYVRK